MQLQSAVVPPPEVYAEALAAAQGLRFAPREVEEAPTGLLQRLARGATKQQASPPEVVPAVVPAEQPFVRLTRFGNVATDDIETLGLALGVDAWDWPAPVVHVSALVLATTTPRPTITAELGGDVDGLRTIFRKVLAVAQSQRFFLDRRIFHPQFPVATVEADDDVSLRERLELDTAAFVGMEWQVTRFSLLGLSFGDTSRVFEEIAVVPLGGAG
ncbi:MAG: hypothetical protein JWN68_1621 [Nocardioides sp.]|jgi:hypothetical protein|uniref:hypothetical protein n=1 Tax=Nocardioides sp. TaxID=35761 RepID=UPI0026208833|nr:hypothetical protein [Nocardioides sp.]MCW2833668.1 hypothetical protein [Nocardioides sp.]